MSEPEQIAESVRDTVAMEPCVGSFVGRVVSEPCDTCGHMLCVHMADRSCPICALIQEVRAEVEGCRDAVAYWRELVEGPDQIDGSGRAP